MKKIILFMPECVLIGLLILVVIGVVVGLLLIVFAEFESRGCYMYRGDAAQILIDKCWLS